MSVKLHNKLLVLVGPGPSDVLVGVKPTREFALTRALHIVVTIALTSEIGVIDIIRRR